MTFTESIKTCLIEKYADFNGRASRSEYWWFALFNVLAYGAFLALSETLALVVGLALLLPGLAVAARRLHDTDKSGWWYLIALIPFVGLVLLVLLALPAKEPNRFGAAPLS